MNRQMVHSSNVHSIGFDEDNSILEVEFNNGSIYQYYHVPQAIYLALMNAPSHGKYLNQNIKDIYTYHKIR